MLFAFGPLQIVHVNVAHYDTSIALFFLKDAQNYPYLLKLCIFSEKKSQNYVCIDNMAYVLYFEYLV